MNKKKIYSLLATAIVVANAASPITVLADEFQQQSENSQIAQQEQTQYSVSFIENGSVVSSQSQVSSNESVEISVPSGYTTTDGMNSVVLYKNNPAISVEVVKIPVDTTVSESTTETPVPETPATEAPATETHVENSTQSSNQTEAPKPSTESSTTQSSNQTQPSTEVPESKTESKPVEEPKVQTQQRVEAPESTTQSNTQTQNQTTPSTPSANVSNLSYNYDFNNDTAKFIASIAEQARVIGQKNDIYASVMIAQAIIESGSGSSELSKAPNNNLFGIKGAFKGESVTFYTMEDDGTGNLYQIQDSFRKYKTTADSLQDYADLIKNSGYYEASWKSNAKTYQQAAQSLQGVYATDTSYASKLIGLIETYKLDKYDEDVKYSKAQYDENGNKLDKSDVEKAEDDTIVKLLSTATSQLGVPYVWGGATLDKALDCSGLVQQVYKEALGINLPRVTTEQEKVGEFVQVDVEKLQPGDLVFFGAVGSSHHVGIYLSNGYFINAPVPGRTVEIENIKNFTPDFAKRVIPTTEKQN